MCLTFLPLCHFHHNFLTILIRVDINDTRQYTESVAAATMKPRADKMRPHKVHAHKRVNGERGFLRP